VLTFPQIIESSADELARPLVPEATPEDWLRAIEGCVMSPSIIFIVGASTCGKSTFARRLLNRYLTGQGKSARPTSSVCYLDLDPLKPEYAPHGQISLTVIRSLNLGPAFTHPVTSPSSQGPDTDETIQSHAVPPNLANYGDYYRACAEDLFMTYKHLRSRDPLLPLIINTSGSLNSAYTSMLMELLARFKPHHVVHLGDTQAIDTEQAAKLDACQIIVSQSHGTLHKITAQAPVIAPMRSDTELRAMQMQSYFHLRKISASEASPSFWTPNPLSALAPWEFCFEETEERMQDFVGFAMYSEPVEPASLVQALNGSIVHIVESTSSAIPSPYTVLPRTKKYRVPFFDKSVRTGMVEPLDPRTSKVVCTALIRAFDPEKRVVQILVPKTHESLLRNLQPERTVLVGGCCDSPEWAYMEDANSRASAQGNSLLAQGETVHAPWVENTGRMESMGYLNTVRRVRKFQT
jgi:polynucleotide 5'-hydroxyl-kinase GRC3/NOL9